MTTRTRTVDAVPIKEYPPGTFGDHAGEAIVVEFEGGDLESFRVDQDKRTISGVVVPWNVVASNGWARWKFAPNSLHWSAPSRVKLNRHHNRMDLIGRATALDSITKGLDATFKLGRRAAATEALDDAGDEILDGFSIEIAFDEDAGDSWQPDPVDESVRLVTRATLRGTALTGGPAFDDARVTSVKASRDQLGKGSSDMAPKGGTDTRPAAGTDGADAFDFETYAENLGEAMLESHRKLTEGLAESIGDSLSEGVKAALENLHDPQRDGPQPVRAARYTVTREAPVYSLNGGGFSLVRDAWYAAREHDHDAVERLRKYRVQTEDMGKIVNSRLHDFMSQQFATVTTGTAAAVIPPGYRPELFVPMLAKNRPMTNRLSLGAIDNATPFIIPVFGTLTGTPADHVEGTNPTDGTLTVSPKTVTPGAISGLLKLTREIVDSSNPAIDAIALAAMRENYGQQTEGKVYAKLNGTNGVGGVITAGLVPSGSQARTTTGGSIAGGTFGGAELLDGMRLALADYPFRRFGDPDVAFLDQEATSAFATAKDTTGRALLPSVNPTNTFGGGSTRQAWDVDSLPAIPAWAMSGNAAGDADVIIINAEDAWAWESPLLTFRYEERSGPALIELALFAYFATEVVRPVGLSGIRHTRGA